MSAARRRRSTTAGEVAERSNAADCKSVALAASEVRILPSPPAFAREIGAWMPAPRTRASARQASRAGQQRELSSRERGERAWNAGRVRAAREYDGGACRAEVRASVRGEHEGGSNSVVESQPSKLLVAGSIPVSRSILSQALAELVARMAGHSAGRRTQGDVVGRSREGATKADLSAVAASDASV